MDPAIYAQASTAVGNFLQVQNPNGLYATWTSHVSTIGGVLKVFTRELKLAGVTDAELQQPYLSAFKRENQIDDNYYS